MFRKRICSLIAQTSTRRLGVSKSRNSEWASIHDARSMLIKNMIGEPAAANMEAVSDPISPSASKFTTKVPLR